MPQDKRVVGSDRDGTTASGMEARAFAKLRELTRSGYVPEASGDGEEDGIRLRHPSAPDLVLHADGKIDLPLGQRPRQMAADPSPRRPNRARIALIVLAAAGLWLLALFLTTLFLES